jgi:hypothetical protein
MYLGVQETGIIIKMRRKTHLLRGQEPGIILSRHETGKVVNVGRSPTQYESRQKAGTMTNN